MQDDGAPHQPVIAHSYSAELAWLTTAGEDEIKLMEEKREVHLEGWKSPQWTVRTLDLVHEMVAIVPRSVMLSGA